MNNNYCKLLLFGVIIVILLKLILFIHNTYNFNTLYDNDTFAIPKTPKEINDNDGNMNFNFLKNENTNYVLSTYYIDDDKKINGSRLNYHKYQKQVPNIPVEGAPPYIYGNPLYHYQRKPKVWNKYDTYAQDIWNKYGVRR